MKPKRYIIVLVNFDTGDYITIGQHVELKNARRQLKTLNKFAQENGTEQHPYVLYQRVDE